MSLPPRQRRPRPTTTGDPSSSSPSYSKLDKPDRSDDEDARDAKKGLSWFLPLFALGTLRYMSVTSNIIHDCDEVFNYWEPLHYLIYKSGFQTWEYSSQFALRSYLYLLFHELVARPASWVFGEDKVRVFYAVRLFLGIISVITETVLVVALSRRYGKRLASYSLAMLCLSSGCFFASTNKIVSLEEVLKFPFYLAILMGGFLGFLPSSFSMYAVTLSSALFLLGKHALAVSVAAAGVIIGWPFSVLAVLPLTFYCLYKRFKQVFISAAVTSLVILGLSFIIDHYFYKRWTSSVFNLLVYNVVGGGESHLYGTEGPLYYLRNGFNNFNFCFVLALLFLAMLPIAKKKYAPDLLVIVSPIYIWIAFMSLQPHKEESLGPCISLAPRIVDLSTANVEVYGFLHPVYPLICVAAAAVIESFPDLFRDKYDPDHNYFLVMAAKILRPIVLSLILCASHSRTFSLINGYSAPLEIYKHLEHHDDAGPGSVLCVGSEWHRFPSSFFVPDYVGEVRWLDDGFRGLLPIPFNNTMGGTAAAPPYFNNKNKAADEQFLRDVNACTFLIELQLQRPYPTRGSDVSKWEVLAALPYLDRELSPAKYRSFFIPYLWQQKNVFGLYKLLRRIPE